MLDKFFITVFLTILSFTLSAQQVEVNAGFVQDHFEVGDNIDFWLSAKYPEGIELVFPDSTYLFSPFEYSAKNYYPSRINDGLIYDSAIYTLQCYEIDRIQQLKLPVFLLSNGDSVLIYSKPDSILFNQLAPQVSDTTQLKTNLTTANVYTAFNYTMMWIILGTLVVLIGLVALIFGKKILRSLKLKKLRKEYLKFSDELTTYIRQLKNAPEKQVAEAAVSRWKQFAEKLENKPYSKMTSKEILAFGYTAELADPLKNIDRFVYGGIQNDHLYKHFQSIEDFTQHRYSIIVEEIKNEK